MSRCETMNRLNLLVLHCRGSLQALPTMASGCPLSPRIDGCVLRKAPCAGSAVGARGTEMTHTVPAL